MTIWVAMTPAEEREYRAEHALGDGESTRKHLAGRVATELDGLGEETGWWSQVRAR